MPDQISILSLSLRADDHKQLAKILRPYPWPIRRASTLPGAMQLLRRHTIGLIVCEREAPPHSWKDLLAEVAGLSQAPFVIVTSLHVDDRFWAEALNLGAYDVLLKPFDTAEVKRSVGIAVLHWQWNQESAMPLPAKASGAQMSWKGAAQ